VRAPGVCLALAASTSVHTDLAAIRERAYIASTDSDPIRPFDVGIDLEEQLADKAEEEEPADSEDAAMEGSASLTETVENASKCVNESTAQHYNRCAFTSTVCCDSRPKTGQRLSRETSNIVMAR